ncbi:hypothetical protein M1567_02840 [Candidatus Marsarchaeota archaeon]|jgi:hypothetical protein|nr:hypothetical protein [Candidatus Marsarchaeota archaeon]
MVFNTAKNNDKRKEEKGESERFVTLSAMITVAYSNGHANIGDMMTSIMGGLKETSKIIRLEEERKLDPGLEELLHKHKNIIYVGPVAPYRKDVTYNTPFSSIAADRNISQHMAEFCKVVSETMDYLLSEKGLSELSNRNVFEDLMSEASFGKDQEILDSMALGMLKGIERIRKNPKSVSNTEYTYAKLLMQNLMLSGFTSQEMKEKLSKAWNSA